MVQPAVRPVSGAARRGRLLAESGGRPAVEGREVRRGEANAVALAQPARSGVL